MFYTFTKLFSNSNKIIISFLVIIGLLTSCSNKRRQQIEEKLDLRSSKSSVETEMTFNSIKGNVPLNQIITVPNSVILTGLADHRLVTVYKFKDKDKPERVDDYYSSYSNDYDGTENERTEHFMPGIDVLFGYNLLNIAHYDLKTEKLNLLFDRPAIIKTVYYPSFVQDSIDKKPITRNYYLLSVYDADTNNDTLINNKDLRRFYHFDATGSVKTQLVPSEYSVERSQYDSKNDLMYLFVVQDTNKNGKVDEKEPKHVLWISLKAPDKAKLLY